MELPKNDMVDRQFYDHRRASELIKTRRNTLNPGECLSLLTREKIKMEKKVAGENKFTFQAVFTLSGGLVLMMVAGLPYAYGNISPYIVSYFRMFQRYNVDYDTFYPMISLTEIIASLIYPYANYLVVKRF